MKERVILIMFVIIYSSFTSVLLEKIKGNYLAISAKSIDIAIADDLWHYFSRFTLNN